VIVEAIIKCPTCKLMFVQGTESRLGFCPSCLRLHGVPKDPVVIAGRKLELRVLLPAGEGILNAEVRRGLDVLVLGDMCPHGWLTGILCEICGPSCNEVLDNDCEEAHI
jgi:hypothetical protein